MLGAGVFASQRGAEAVNTGVARAQSSLSLAGSVHGEGVEATVIETAEDKWVTPDPNVSDTMDGADYKEGAFSTVIAIDEAFTTGLVARENLGANFDISAHYTVSVWLKVDADIPVDTLVMIFDDSSNCATPLDEADLPALSAATGWAQVQVRPADPSLLTAIRCVGLRADADPGAVSIHLDEVQGTAELQRLHIALEAATSGAVVDLTATTDAGGDGLLTDEAAPNHRTQVRIADKHQLLGDVAWVATWLGRGDGDVLLEGREKVSLAVDLSAMFPMPTANSSLTVGLHPSGAAALSLELAVPKWVDPVMRLR